MRGLTRSEVTERAGISPAQLHRYECGRSAVTIATLQRLAPILGLPPESLFTDLQPLPEQRFSQRSLVRHQRQLIRAVATLNPRLQQVIGELARAPAQRSPAANDGPTGDKGTPVQLV